MLLLLIGPRASGKSTIGRALATRLGVPFSDLDELVLARFAEPSVTAVWAAHGEAAWRHAEVDVLRALLEADHGASGNVSGVLALGGGAPVISGARDLISRARVRGVAKVVFLRTSPAALVRRLESDPGDRPPLTASGSIAAEVETVLRTREPVYFALADHVAEADRSPEALVESLVRQFSV